MADDSKLYNALLKSRPSESSPSEADKVQESPTPTTKSVHAPWAKNAKKQQARESEPAATTDWLLMDEDDEPINAQSQENEASEDWGEPEELNGFSADSEQRDRGWPPMVFDTNSALKNIHNPRPWTPSQLRRRRIIYSGMPNKSILNAYRELRINLRNRSRTQNFSVLMASLSRQPGSVLTAFNLAASFAMDSHTSALLVDCDPHHSSLQRLVSTPLRHGITDFVADTEMTVMDVIYPSGLDRLNVIPAGQLATSAVELFSSQRMSELMNELHGRYQDRVLIINAPAFRVSTEARILERYSSQTVLTVPFGEVSAEDILSSVSTLHPEKFAGLVYQE